MARIKIKNFGPIRKGFLENDGWIDISKIMVFIGNQGSGKSTIAKIITTFLWIEKALVRGDYNIKWFSRKNKLKNQFLKYFRLENYFSSDSLLNTEIDYKGDAYSIKYQDGSLYIEEMRNGRPYELPQIMYVPAERNFIANVKTPKALKLTSDYLVEFVTEFDNAKAEIKGAMPLPVNGVFVDHNKQKDIVYIKGKDYRIKLTEASSGYQSIVPLYLVSWFLSDSVKQSENRSELMTSEQRERFRKNFQFINNNEDLTDEQRRIMISELGKQFTKTAFINIVEEPEQNLFPSSQRFMLNSLLEFNNMNRGNKLIMTTHSPYLINYLTLAVKAEMVKRKITTNWAKDKLKEIVPIKSTIEPSDLIIYQMNEIDGTIGRLDDYKGLPEDDNFLNNSIKEVNNEFDKLRQIEKNA